MDLGDIMQEHMALCQHSSIEFVAELGDALGGYVVRLGVALGLCGETRDSVRGVQEPNPELSP